MAEKKKWSAATKFEIALLAITGETTLNDLCKRYQVAPSQVHVWKKELLGRGAELFGKADGYDKPKSHIEGEAGLGYILRPGFMLPPLMFSEEEIEALVLGSRWVAARGDARLKSGALSALHKIAAVLPTELRQELDASTLLPGPPAEYIIDVTDVAEIRRTIRAEHKATIDIAYRICFSTTCQ